MPSGTVEACNVNVVALNLDLCSKCWFIRGIVVGDEYGMAHRQLQCVN